MANGNGSKTNNYLAKVVAYIPGEIVAAYVAAGGALEQARDDVPLELMLWLVAGVLLILTPIWVLVAMRKTDDPPPVFQAVAATVAFACWVFALGGPFEFQTWYQPVYGTLVLTFVTLVIPLAEKAFHQPLNQLINRRNDV